MRKKNKKLKIFLSHSSSDKPFVDRLARDLDELNIGVWYDKWEIKVGDSLIDKISRGIEKNDYLALILSKNSIKSKWVKKEINAAFMKEMTGKKVVILPIMLEQCKIPTLLAERKWANFTREYEVGFNELLNVIDPNNPSNEDNKEYIEIKKMLSGLSTNDKNGTNILNSYQISDIYKFKNRLINSSYISYEELRLLFLSRIAFNKINNSGSDLLNCHLPMWELLKDINLKECANFIAEKINGPLIQYLLPYYEWSCNELKININRDLIKGAAVNFSSSTIENSKDMTKDTKFLTNLFSILAKVDDDVFENINLSDIKHLSNRTSTCCAILESSVYLKKIPELSFYFSALSTNEEQELSAYKALLKINPIEAMKFLNRSKYIKCKDDPYNMIETKEVIDILKDWYNNQESTDIKIKIQTVLINLGSINDEQIYDLYKNNIDSNHYFIKPALIRMMGRISNKELFNVKEHINSENPLEVETALYSYLRLYKKEALDTFIELLESKFDSVIAVSIECIAEILGKQALEVVGHYIDSKNPIIKTGFYRALYVINDFDYKIYIDKAFKEENLEVLIFASKIIIEKTPTIILQKYLNDADTSIVVKTLIDEYLWGKKPFVQEWNQDIGEYNSNLAKYKLRLTNYNTEKLILDHSWDMNKTFYNAFCI